MRVLCLVLVVLTAACRVPYTSDLADWSVLSFDLPEEGTAPDDLGRWFESEGYVAGPKVFQTEAELRRRPGTPLVYALPGERSWWLSQVQTVRDLCVTQKFIYYRTRDDGRLARAVGAVRSQC